MSSTRPSLIALVLDRPVDDVGAVVSDARAVGGIDRAAPHVGDGRLVQDVHWGGRMQRAVVRALDEDGVALLCTELAIASDGYVEGLARQATLVASLARVLSGRIRGVRDLSARIDRDEAWLTRTASGVVEVSDAIVATVGDVPARVAAGRSDRSDMGWVLTHGAARLGVPDLELYGVPASDLEPARDELMRIAGQLAVGGLGSPLALTDGTPVRLVPVLEVWSGLPASWPGPGRAGVDRGPGLDGPRATLSVLHRPRLGRHRLDLAGVRERLRSRQ